MFIARLAWVFSFLGQTTVGNALSYLGGLSASSPVLAGDLNADSHKITNLSSPSSANDAANKSYVDAAINGLDYKQEVRVASTANVNISSPGSSIDGVSLSNGDRVLLKNQSTGSQNGIYVWNGAASAMTRATDCDADAEVTAGLTTFVSEGTANANQLYALTTDAPITVGTTALTFTQIGSLSLGSSSPAALGSASAGSASVAAKEDHVHPTTGLVVAAGTGLTGQLVTLGRKLSVNSISANATLSKAHDVNAINTGGGSVTATLPAAPADGTEILVKRIDMSNPGTNTCTIAADGSDSVEDATGADVSSFTIANRTSIRLWSPTGVSGKWFLLA